MGQNNQCDDYEDFSESYSNCIVPKEIFREANVREHLIGKAKEYISFLDGEIAEIKRLIRNDDSVRIRFEGTLINAMTSRLRAVAALAENEMLEKNYLDKMRMSWQDGKLSEFKVWEV